MKSNINIKKRILTVVLCMVLVLSTGISTMADGEVAEGTTSTPENAVDQEPAAAGVEGEAVGSEQGTADESSDSGKATETQEKIPTETNTPDNTDVPDTDENSISGVTELVGGNSAQKETPEQGTETGNEITDQETETVSEAIELKQEFTDENGNVVQRVTANLPEGAFQANASEITMEVNYLDEAAENHLKELMTNALPENDILGDYILYDIKFKVNGEVTEPQKEIAITFEGSGLHIEDTKKANAFYLDPADPQVQDDKDEIVEIIQKNEMMETLQNAGQSVENIDEYDLSEISVNTDGIAEKIQMEGRTSTIYGCYVEKTLEPVQTLTYEDDDVIVNVDAYTENAIPAGAALKVVPIKPDDAETEEQYKEVEEQLNKKAENEEYDIAGFLAYDITFINENGEEVEPDGDVKVTMEYKNEVIPEEVKAEDDTALDVTVMHLEENSKGDVKEVVDMVADSSKEALIETTEDAKIKKAEFVTDSFSAYTITWKYSKQSSKEITVVYVDTKGNSLAPDYAPKNFTSTEAITINGSSQFAKSIEGYEFDHATAGRNGSSILKLRYNSGEIQYETTMGWDGNGRRYFAKWENLSSNSLYMVYRPTHVDQVAGNTSTSQLGAPAHTKTIKKNNDNDYTLSLDITGGVETLKPLNVLLVVDVSGSMKFDAAGYETSNVSDQRWNYTNTAIETLLDKLTKAQSGNRNLEINVSMTAFSDETKESYSRKWQSLSSFKNSSWKLDQSKIGGSTNWCDAFSSADALLTTKKGENNYVIFLTDGNPTSWRDTNGNIEGTGNETASNNIVMSYGYAKEAWARTTFLRDTRTFVVQASSSADYCNTIMNYADSLKSNVASLVDGTDKTKLNQAFSEIAAKLVPDSYKNVSITDTLSDYVDFPDGFSKADVSIVTVTKKSDGTETENAFTEAYTTTVDKTNKKIVVELLNGGELKKDVIYRIKFHVTPSAKAYSEYAANGDNYGNVVGDANTDSWDNKPITSSEQAGFYSNNSDETYVTYSTDVDTGLKANYARPVIQVKRDISSELTYDKTAEVTDYDNRTYNITLSASSTVTSTIKPEPVDVVMVLDRSGSMLFPSSLTPVAYNKTITTNSYNGLNSLSGDGPFYAISDPKGTATVFKLHKVWNNSSRRYVWYYVDASYSTNGSVVPSEAFKLRSEDTSTSYTIYKTDDSNDRLYYLQNAVNSFVSQLGEYSPESRVGVVQFCATANNLTNGFVSLDANGVSEITNAVSNISTDGGTRQDLGLKNANDMLSDSTSERKKIVILVTDGAPNPYSVETIQAVKSQASMISSKATLMTVGLSLGDVQNARSLMEEIASAQDDGTKYAFDAENGASLEGVLDSMFQTITNSVPVTGETVKDYINDSFYLLNSDGSVAKEGDAVKGGTVHFDENGCYIEWTNQTIAGKSISGTAGWTKTFVVKAKEDFMGGNVIATNKGGSGITVENSTLSFPEPTVNVKLLELNRNEKEKTVFIGDTISVDDIKNMASELASDIKIKEIVGADGNPVTDGNPAKEIPLPADCQLKDEDIVTLLKGESVNKTYSYAGASNIGTFTYTFVPEENKGSLDEHVTTEAGKRIEEYVLKVVYTPNPAGDCSNNGANGPGEQVTTVIESNNVYYLNVIAGTIQINKNIDKVSDNDMTFEFRIEKAGDPNWSITLPITVAAGSTNGSLSQEDLTKLNKLPRGTYTVSEEVNDTGYILSDATNGGSNCMSSINDAKEVSFTVGKDASGVDIIPALNIQSGVLGVANFTNKLANSDEPDKPYILVEKTFTGLNDPVTQLPDFVIGIYRDAQCNNLVKVLRLTDQAGLTISNNGLTFTWKIDNVDAGTYYVKEENETYAGYSVITTINGKEVSSNAVTEITTVTAKVELKNIKYVPNCNFFEYRMGTGVSFLTTATTDGNYFIWTAKTLSASERHGIVKTLKDSGDFTGKYNSITIDNVQFYSTTQKLSDGINYRGNKIQYEEESGRLIFAQKKQWNYFYYGTYDPGENVNAEIKVTNAYKGSTTVDLIKYAGSYNGDVLDTAEFEIYKGVKDENETMKWTPYKLGEAEDSYKLTVTKAEHELKNIPPGYYKLTETKAPSGYMLLKDDIYFKIDTGVVTLLDDKGETIEEMSDKWKLETVDGIQTIKIINYEMYTLPSAGGIGIYWYMVGGVLLMIAAALILYKNKHREVLEN